AYLGWSPGDDSEIHSFDELIELFTLDRVSKGGAVFNHKKLLWYNEHYLREQPDAQIADRLKVISDDGLIENVNDEYLKSAVGLLKERISKIEEILEMGRFFFEDPKEYDEKALKKWKDDSAELVGIYKTEIEELSDFEAGNLKSSLESVINAKGVGFGKLMMPLRIAITGQGFGPDLFASMELLGKEAVTRRIDTALEKLG
ncbi:MAG: glutamate--tRNA ligase, partial [Bacteroidetes bacterium]|nr:glutamate--tRNA ligase [Bacteroidota bacterium]